jgi:hypothetical protein
MSALLDTRVPEFRTPVTLEDFRVGRPVRATSWWDLAQLVQWVRGRGRTLVPQHAVRKTITSGSQTFRWRTHPSGVAITRVWVADIRQDPTTYVTSPGCAFTVQAGGASTSGTIYRSGRAIDSTTVVYLETGLTRSAALSELTYTVTQVSGRPTVESIGAWELPRAALAKDSTDLGISLDSFFPRRQIFEATYEGTRAVVLASAGSPGRRIGHVGWSAGYESLTSSGTFVSVFTNPHPIVPRIDRPADTTRVLAWDVYARVTDGTTSGEFRIAIGSGGASGTVAVPLGATSNAWRGTGSVSLKCEDLSTANGLRGGSYETVDLQLRRTAGAGQVGVTAYSVWEDT